MNWNSLLNNRRIQLLFLVLFLSLFLVFFKNGWPPQLSSNLGIEFVGGVEIPVLLQQPTDPVTMSSMVQTIDLRINKLGLGQANVQSVGDSEILVEIPQAGSSAINNVEEILRQQGSFEAIIDGVQALNGSDIIPSSVGGSNEQVSATTGGYYWELGFTATSDGAQKFANAANGKAHYPVFMFLDRPTNATILLEESWYNESNTIQATSTALEAAAHMNGDDIQIIWLDNWDNNTLSQITTYSTIIVDSGLSTRRPQVYQALLSAGYVNASANTTGARGVIQEHPLSDMVASLATDQEGLLEVNSWNAIGLLSGPELDPSLATGFVVSPSYQITGTATGDTPADAQASAVQQVKDLTTVISGGRLPVPTYVGSSYSVSASLGQQFLLYSVYALLLAIVVVGLLIVLRYRNLSLFVPIMLIDLCEVLITVAIVGTFGTLDLAAAAGIITLVGTAVDNQIIITDELLSRKHSEEAGHEHEHAREQEGFAQKLGKAFHIIFTTAAIAIVAMMPLLLSGIVQITGFALSTIIGIVVGVLVTRPAYGVILEEMFRKPGEEI